jgi:hypothetical protein
MGAKFIPRRAEEQSSYISEVAGICSIIVCISLVMEFFEIKEGSVELACDGIEVLHSISR